jgi:hypothetical protein
VVESSALLNPKRHFVPNPPSFSSLFNSKPARQLHRIAFLPRSLTSSYFILQAYLFDLPFSRIEDPYSKSTNIYWLERPRCFAPKRWEKFNFLEYPTPKPLKEENSQIH